jgi:hypothetical protein
MTAGKDIDPAASAILGAGDAAYVWDLASDRIVWTGWPEDVFGPRAEFPPTG